MAEPNQALRNARLAKGISLRTFAKLIGVNLTTVYRWEMGLQDPYPIHKTKLTQFFDKSLSELGLALERGASLGHDAGEGKTALFRSSQPVVFAEVELVGRTCDLVTIRERVLAGRAALVGLPGVGKTALALEVASDAHIRAAFSHGILWADLGQHAHLDGVLRSWCEIFLGFSPQKMARMTREKLIISLQPVISQQQVCFVLDDVWASADARTLLEVAGPHCGVLVTSRSPVIAAELVGNEVYVLRELDETDGFHLLRLFASQAVETEPEKARELVRAVGGLPLALTLMGHYLANEAVSGQARRIARALEHLFDRETRLNTGEHSLRSVISLSEKLLSEEERIAFHALSLLPPKPGSFTEQAALAVGCPIERLDTFVDLGLLEVSGEDYRMHQTIHDYCQAMLFPTERTRAKEHLLSSILGDFGIHAAEPAWLAREKQMILLAIDVAKDLDRPKDLLHLTLLMAPLLIYQGWLSLSHTYLRQACEIGRQQETAPELPRLLQFYGETLMLLAFVQEGMAAYHEGLRLARQMRDDACACEILGTLAWFAHVYGEYNQADTYIKEGMAIAVSLDLPNQLWVFYRVQGSQAWARGKYAQAEEAYQRGLSLMERLDDRALIETGMYYCFLAVFEGERGHYAQAEIFYQQGIEASQVYGFRDFVPFIVARRAMMRVMYDPSDALRDELQEAILAAQGSGSWAYGVYVLKALAQLELIRGNLDRADEIAHQALALIEPFQTKNRLGEHRTILAQIELARGHYAQASTYLQQALPLLRLYGAAEDKAIALVTLGELELARGDLSAAEVAFRELFAVGPADFLAPLALGSFGRARLAEARHHYQEAHQLGEASLQTLEKLKHVRAPEIRAWLEQLPKPRFEVFRQLRKRNQD